MSGMSGAANEIKIYDPSEPGPFGRCYRCFTVESQECGFCLKCGRLRHYLADTNEYEGRMCVNHANSQATSCCCLCGKAVCAACVEKEGYSISAASRLPYCKACCLSSLETERRYLATLQERRCCSKHTDLTARFTCQGCSMPLCEFCSYFKRRGLLRVKVGEGPYCLACFRHATLDGGRNRWVAGFDALRWSLVRA
jgi:hypothetical protein